MFILCRLIIDSNSLFLLCAEKQDGSLGISYSASIILTSSFCGKSQTCLSLVQTGPVWSSLVCLASEQQRADTICSHCGLIKCIDLVSAAAGDVCIQYVLVWNWFHQVRLCV